MIGGSGVVMEVDEAQIGQRKYNRGRFLTGQWVFGGIERGNTANFVVVFVEARTADMLLEIITRKNRPGTTIMSDCWGHTWVFQIYNTKT